MELRIYTASQQGATYDDQLAVARTAEDCGYGAFFRSDHFLNMGDGTGLPGPTDAWITLAGLARDTTTIRLGTLVSPATFRHPAELALDLFDIESGSEQRGQGSGSFFRVNPYRWLGGIGYEGLDTRLPKAIEGMADSLILIEGIGNKGKAGQSNN